MAVSAACRHNLLGVIKEYRRILPTNQRSYVSTASLKASLTRFASQAALASPSDPFLNEYLQCIAMEVQSNLPYSTLSPCIAILEGFARSGKWTLEPNSQEEKLVLQFARSSPNPDHQVVSIMLLGSCSSDASQRVALQCLELPDVRMQRAAIGSCSIHNTPGFVTWLIDQFPNALPELRQDVFNAILKDPKRLSFLLDKLESGDLSTKLLDASQTQTLRSNRDSNLSPRIAKVLASSLNSNRQAVIDSYAKEMASIKVEPNDNRGKAIFAKQCAACHKLDGIGTLVGPDISDSRDQSFDKLLVSILDPNRSIDANYFRYLVRSLDGSVVEGILKDSNAQTITLQSQQGSMVTLPRNEMEELKSSGASLMPEGIESQISPRDMAELLWYIKNWRYAAGNIPANATR